MVQDLSCPSCGHCILAGDRFNLFSFSKRSVDSKNSSTTFTEAIAAASCRSGDRSFNVTTQALDLEFRRL